MGTPQGAHNPVWFMVGGSNLCLRGAWRRV